MAPRSTARGRPSRLESLTKNKGVQVLVSDETARRAAGTRLERIGAVALRGREEPLEVHALPLAAP